MNPDFGNNGVFSYIHSYSWAAYYIKQIQLSADQKKLYFVGRYRLIIQLDNMMISRLDISDKTVAVGQIGDQERHLKLYPNPVSKSSRLFLEALGLHWTDDSQLQIWDSRGRLIIQQKIKALDGGVGIDISTLNNGVYFVEVLSGDIRYTEKVLITE